MTFDGRISVATADDELAIRRLLDGALLEYDDLPEAIESEAVTVAATKDGRIRGVAVWEGERTLRAIAVHSSHRGRGIGRALVTAHDGPVVATFDESVSRFYERLGFEIESQADGRMRGRLKRDPE